MGLHSALGYRKGSTRTGAAIKKHGRSTIMMTQIRAALGPLLRWADAHRTRTGLILSGVSLGALAVNVAVSVSVAGGGWVSMSSAYAEPTDMAPRERSGLVSRVAADGMVLKRSAHRLMRLPDIARPQRVHAETPVSPHRPAEPLALQRSDSIRQVIDTLAEAQTVAPAVVATDAAAGSPVSAVQRRLQAPVAIAGVSTLALLATVGVGWNLRRRRPPAPRNPLHDPRRLSRVAPEQAEVLGR